MKLSGTQIAVLISALMHGIVLSVAPLIRSNPSVESRTIDPVLLQFIPVGDEVTSPSAEPFATAPMPRTPIADEPAPKSEVVAGLVTSSPTTPEPISTVPVTKPSEADRVAEIPDAEPVRADAVSQLAASTDSLNVSADAQPQVTAAALVSSSLAPAGGPRSHAPCYRFNPAPRYPGEARVLNQEGQVLIAVTVTAEGLPEKITVRQSSGFSSLDQAALAAVKSWRFSPAQTDERAIAARVEIPIDFKLRN
ncbi:MAG TPA: energy transducer TonB [Candidatus Dormibacteraeota bacterium]|nr:energy transducer TonB [Candidatus Dormibacteraeota bacterium]